MGTAGKVGMSPSYPWFHWGLQWEGWALSEDSRGSLCWSQYRPDAECPGAPPLTGRQARSVHSAFLAISPNLFMERNVFSAGSQREHGLQSSSSRMSSQK